MSPQCLVEAVLVLDVLCRQDPSFLYRTLSCLRALHARLCGDPTCVRALLPVAQFFLHHGEPPPPGDGRAGQSRPRGGLSCSQPPARNFPISDPEEGVCGQTPEELDPAQLPLLVKGGRVRLRCPGGSA